MLDPGRKISVPHRLEDGQTAVSDVFQFLVFNALERLDAKLLVLFELGLVFRLISVVVLRHLPRDDGMKDMIEMPIEFLRASMAEMQRDFLEEETWLFVLRSAWAGLLTHQIRVPLRVDPGLPGAR
jgi:hypothetical protein